MTNPLAKKNPGVGAPGHGFTERLGCVYGYVILATNGEQSQGVGAL